MALTRLSANSIGTNAVDADELAATGVTPGTYGSESAIPQFTVDTDGRITAASQNTITNLSVGTLTTSGNLTVGGDIIVTGDTITVTTQNLLIEDNIVTLTLNASGGGAPLVDAGMEIDRGASPTVGIHWNETDDVWELTVDGTNYYTILTTNSTLDSTKLSPNLTTLGTVTTGIWNADIVGITYGGTGGSTAGSARQNLGLEIGVNVQAYDADLDGLSALSANGVIARTGAGTFASRTISAGAGITVTNGDGASGNPSIALTNNAVTINGSSVALGSSLTLDTDDIGEGTTNLYYTNTRVATYLSSNSYATQSYVDTAVSNLVDSAPSTLNTLNELAAALGDDPNYATTIATSLGNKLNTADFTSTADTWLGTKSTTNLAEGTNLYYTDARARGAISVTGAGSYNSGTGVITITGGVTSVNSQTGAVTLNTDNINEGSTNQYYTNTRARAAVSASSATGITYNSATGEFSLSSIPNASLTNSSITINGSNVSLGGSTTIDALPSQSGESGKYLTTNGTTASWVDIQTGNTWTADTTPHASPIAGDKWYDTTNNILYEYQDDGTNSYWVDISTANVTSTWSNTYIDGLLDVDTTTTAPTNGQALVWNSGSNKWIPGTISTSSVTETLTNKTIAGATISGHLIPSANVTYDLGSSSYRFRDLYLSGSTIDLGGATMTTDATTGTIALVGKPTETNPNPTALVITSEGKTTSVATTAGEVNFTTVATQIESNPGFSGSYSDLTNKPDFSAFNNSIVPDTDNTRDLGSSNKTWRHVYIGPGSLYVNGKQVITDDSDTITVSTSINQDLRFETTGTGDIEIDAAGTGAIKIQSTLQIEAGSNITSSDGNAIGFGNAINVDNISSKTTNGNLVLAANGTGYVNVNDDLVVSGNLTISGTTTTINTETISLADNIIDLNSNFTTGSPTENAGIRIMRGDSANVSIRWNETSDKWEFTNDGTTYNELGAGTVALTSFSVTDAGGDGSLSYNNLTGVFTYTGPSSSEVRAHFAAGTGITITSGTIATTITQYTDALARAAISAGTGISYNSTTGVISSSITQYTDSAARSAVSVTDSGGDGSLSYNNTTGVFTYTGPSASEVRAHFSAGTGISISSGQISATPYITWEIVATNTTCVAGKGYFVNTTSGAITMTLPASATLGDTIRFNDLAGTFGTNNLTVARNGHKIQGVADDLLVADNQSSFGLVYSNSTYGWKIMEL